MEDLKEVFELPKSGNKPVRLQGSRWIYHKCMAWLIDMGRTLAT